MVGKFPRCEFRALRSGVGSKSGKPYNVVRWEDSEGASFEAWVSPEVAQNFTVLNKGDVVTLICRVYVDNRGYKQVAVDGFEFGDLSVA